MITAKKKHDKNKKQIIYDNAIKKFKIPVTIFSKIFHPDPTVDRQSGFLRPQLNNSSILGNSKIVQLFLCFFDRYRFYI